jgi:hypothetical protein
MHGLTAVYADWHGVMYYVQLTHPMRHVPTSTWCGDWAAVGSILTNACCPLLLGCRFMETVAMAGEGSTHAGTQFASGFARVNETAYMHDSLSVASMCTAISDVACGNTLLH